MNIRKYPLISISILAAASWFFLAVPETRAVYAKPIPEAVLAALIESQAGEVPESASVPKKDASGIIENLRLKIAELQERIKTLTSAAEPKAVLESAKSQEKPVVTFTVWMKRGQQNDEVKKLQEFLAADKEIYPEGFITGFFGELTENAVKRFQEKYAGEILTPLGLRKGTGFFGPRTREKINSLVRSAIKMDFTINGEKEVTVPVGSPITLAWNVQNANLNELTPCEAKAYIFPDGKKMLLSPSWYEWIRKQPVYGKVDVLAYFSGSKIIFDLSCSDENGFWGSGIAAANTINKGQGDISIEFKIKIGDEEKIVDTVSLSDIGSELAFSWVVSGGIEPIVCHVSENNDILLKNLPSSGNYSVSNPAAGENYYVNCLDAEEYYNWEGVNIVK